MEYDSCGIHPAMFTIPNESAFHEWIVQTIPRW